VFAANVAAIKMLEAIGLRGNDFVATLPETRSPGRRGRAPASAPEENADHEKDNDVEDESPRELESESHAPFTR